MLRWNWLRRIYSRSISWLMQRDSWSGNWLLIFLFHLFVCLRYRFCLWNRVNHSLTAYFSHKKYNEVSFLDVVLLESLVVIFELLSVSYKLLRVSWR